MSKPDIGIIYPDYFREDFGEIITKDIENDNLNLQIKQQETQLWASYEWVVPGIISAYLFKPYFEGFLNEAGKDHYQYLKKCFSKLLRFTKDIPVKTLTSSKSVNKIDKNNTQSKAVSIHIELKNNIRLKIMFDNELSIDEWLIALNSILDLVQNHYDNFPKDELSKRLQNFDSESPYEIFAIINKNSKKWEFFDFRMAFERRQRK